MFVYIYVLFYICVWTDFMYLILVCEEEFWNVDLHTTEFSHVEMTLCSWQDVITNFY